MRHERRLKRRRTDFRVVAAIAVLALVAWGGVELGRSYFYMQDVQRFSASIDKITPAEVKSRVESFSHGLGDRNPLIRRASMMAMKMATGWRLGNDPAGWRLFWFNHGPTWQYHPETSAPPVETKSPWLNMLPVQGTNAATIPAK